MRNVAAIILAAGRSSRMGAFKPLLPFGPKTVIATCIAHLRAGGVENVLVVISEGPQAESIKDHLQNAGVTFVVNPEPFSEMSASIVRGVRTLPKTTEAVVLNPVDHAAVPAAVVELLISEWRQGARLVKPTWQGRGGHPVLIDLKFREELQRLNAPGGLKTFFDLHQSQVQRVPVTSDLIVRDMNTWTDYDALHRNLFGFPPPDLIGKLKLEI